MRDGGERRAQPADAELVRRCLRGEVEAFRFLVERHQDRVYNLAFRLLGHPDDALDAAQETFILAYRALARFDMERPMQPWLLRIAANVAYGMLRKRPTGQLSLDAMTEAEADAALANGEPHSLSADPQDLAARAVEDAEIRNAVLGLPEPYRTVTLLHYMEQMSYETIAAALAMPLGTVKTYLHRARGRLRKQLEAGESKRRM